MKKATFISMLLISCFGLSGQDLDKTYYLVGSLEDYMGREYPKNNPLEWGFIARLHEHRIGEIKRIEQVARVKFKRNWRKRNCDNCNEFFELSSIFKVGKVNSFYNLEKKSEMKDLLGFSFYSGHLIEDRILNADSLERISFLAGLFLTCGERIDDHYKISLYNSPVRYEIAMKLLENLNCEIISKETQITVPVGYFVEFKPSRTVDAVLKRELKERNTRPEIVYNDNAGVIEE